MIYAERTREREIPEPYAECELPAGVQQGTIAWRASVHTYPAIMVCPSTETSRAEIIHRMFKRTKRGSVGAVWVVRMNLVQRCRLCCMGAAQKLRWSERC